MDVVQYGGEVVHHVLAGRAPPQDLLNTFISKLLGVGILAGACITKVPQIMSVWNAGSAAGLSVFATELENWCYLIHTSYGYVMELPVTAYGEAFLMWLQNFLLLFIVYRFSKASFLRPLITLALVGAVGTAVAQGAIDAPTITRMYDMNTLVFMVARIPQIYSSFAAGRTGQLSFFTSFLQFAGGAVRIFTSIQENAGLSMVRGFAIGSILNGIVVAQILYYGADGRGPKKKAE